MSKNQPHVVVALVGDRVEHDDGSVEIGTILMGEYPTIQQADKECRRRNALELAVEHITVSAADYALMWANTDAEVLSENYRQPH